MHGEEPDDARGDVHSGQREASGSVVGTQQWPGHGDDSEDEAHPGHRCGGLDPPARHEPGDGAPDRHGNDRGRG